MKKNALNTCIKVYSFETAESHRFSCDPSSTRRITRSKKKTFRIVTERMNHQLSSNVCICESMYKYVRVCMRARCICTCIYVRK